jgi:hypothetical protein
MYNNIDISIKLIEIGNFSESERYRARASEFIRA